MKIIIDTHIFLWTLSAPEKIERDRRKQLELLSNTIYVSAVTVSELMIKSSTGKLKIDFDIMDLIHQSGFETLDFRAEDAFLLGSLPFHHKDPFDRMLIAQAIANNYYIMSNDSKFNKYECKLI